MVSEAHVLVYISDSSDYVIVKDKEMLAYTSTEGEQSKTVILVALWM